MVSWDVEDTVVKKKDCQLEGGISGQGRYLKEGSMRPDTGGQMNIMFYGDQLNF